MVIDRTVGVSLMCIRTFGLVSLSPQTCICTQMDATFAFGPANNMVAAWRLKLRGTIYSLNTSTSPTNVALWLSAPCIALGIDKTLIVLRDIGISSTSDPIECEYEYAYYASTFGIEMSIVLSNFELVWTVSCRKSNMQRLDIELMGIGFP